MIIAKSYLGAEMKERILSEIAVAESIRTDPDANIETQVHEIRKAIKRMRALLRLTKSNLSDKKYYKIDKIFAKAAAALSEMRESTVNLQTFLVLYNMDSTGLSSRVSMKIIEAFTQDIEKYYAGNSSANPERLHSTFFYLNRIKQAFSKSFHFTLERNDLISSLDKAFIKAQDSFLNASYTLETEVIHTWRKNSKTVLLQLKFAPSLDKQALQALVNDLNTLTNTLGKEHDLAVMEERIIKIVQLSVEEKQSLHLIVSKLRARLQKKAFKLGVKIFSPEEVKIKRSQILSI